MSRFISAALLLVLAGVASAATATHALSHSELVSATPEEGEVLAKAPTEVVLTFGEEVLDQSGTIVVTGPDADRYDKASSVEASGTEASVQLRPAGASGDYQVSYRVVSADGHIVEGTYDYRLQLGKSSTSPTPSVSSPAPAQPSTTPAADQDEGSGGAVWVLGLGAIGVVLVAAVVAVALRGRRG